MATILTTDITQKPWKPAALADQVGQMSWDGVTWRTRTPARRRPPPAIMHQFANTLRAAARTWHNDLDESGRAAWLAVGQYVDGARPGRRPPPTNGWNQFAMYAFAPIMRDVLEDEDLTQQDRSYPDAVFFDRADLATGLLTFTVRFPFVGTPDRPGFVFAYQVRPDRAGKPGALRYTGLAAYATLDPAAGLEQQVSGFAPFGLQADTLVQCLVRCHWPESGTLNWDLSSTPN